MSAIFADGFALDIVVPLGTIHREILRLIEDRNLYVIGMGSADLKIKDERLGVTAGYVLSCS